MWSCVMLRIKRTTLGEIYGIAQIFWPLIFFCSVIEKAILF